MAESTKGERLCISCGMPLRDPQDFWHGDTSKDYCVYCSHEDGSMRNYDEAVEGMTGFMMKTQGMAKEQARQATLEYLAKMPAWQQK